MRRTAPHECVTITGVGLFTGREVTCRIRPPSKGELPGITFARTDAPGRAQCTIAAAHEHDTPSHALARTTTIILDSGEHVHMVEHLLSALAGLGVTDAAIEVNGSELPAGDGSSALWTDALMQAGIEPLAGDIAPVKLHETIRVQDDTGAWIEATPSETPAWEYQLDYALGPIPPQKAAWNGDPETYVRDIAPARTFCLEEEALAMRAQGFFTHLTPRDMLVFGKGGPIDNTLRFDNEPARHKLLDLIGDLALVARPLCARITAHRSGHALNRAMARRLAQA